ncbi:WecB/TagA/CpsF family glycosyltransferase [Brevundimonas balnearis]|uniref:WecB/TagA/CpsF family glycosyltransferase n=1 Tax=Brevundimonas balnearis TaxID=1572858 RepID=A0ABV6QYL7_9CAUL
MLNEAPALRRADAPPRLVFDVNGHAISMAAQDGAFRAALDAADIVHADGGVIVAASRLTGGGGIPDRSATTDVYLDCLLPAAVGRVRMYLLGGRPGVARACAERSALMAPGLDIVGDRHGYFSEDEEAAVVEEINAAAPDVVWVGLGKPKEQAFCLRHRDRLKCGWLVTCGGLFNYVTGDYPRAPRWMQRSGLEWLHRLATNPRHLLWRYATTNPHALWLIATKLGGPGGPSHDTAGVDRSVSTRLRA